MSELVRRIKFMRIRGYAMPPFQKWRTDAGSDLVCVEDVSLAEGAILDLHTGVVVEFPEDTWGLIIGRSSTYRKRGLLVVPGVIDPGYRGELLTCVVNNGPAQEIHMGQRLAQVIVIPKAARLEWQEVQNLSPGDRNLDGFGSTGGVL